MEIAKKLLGNIIILLFIIFMGSIVKNTARSFLHDKLYCDTETKGIITQLDTTFNVRYVIYKAQINYLEKYDILYEKKYQG